MSEQLEPARPGAGVQQVNPVEVARTALSFLQRCDLKPYERSAFAACEALLQGIASGQITLSAAPAPAPNGARRARPRSAGTAQNPPP